MIIIARQQFSRRAVATVANAGQLTDWIERVHGPTHLGSDFRPVPLQFSFCSAKACTRSSTMRARDSIPTARSGEHPKAISARAFAPSSSAGAADQFRGADG